MKNTNHRTHEKSGLTAKKPAAPPQMSEDQMSEIDMDMKADEMPSSSEEDLASEVPLKADSKDESTTSFGSIISKSIAKESQATIDQTLGEIGETYQTAKNYVTEQPAEAALLACTAALATWALLGTKPGRKLFDAAAERYVPEITSWASKKFKGAIQ